MRNQRQFKFNGQGYAASNLKWGTTLQAQIFFLQHALSTLGLSSINTNCADLAYALGGYFNDESENFMTVEGMDGATTVDTPMEKEVLLLTIEPHSRKPKALQKNTIESTMLKKGEDYFQLTINRVSCESN